MPARVTSAEAILALGLRIIDEEGLDALSVRRIGQELGVAPMSVYTYVQTKDHMLDEIVSLALDDVPVPAPEGTWEDSLVEIISALHSGLLKHPGVTELIMRRPPPIAAFDRFRESILVVLRDGGFAAEDAVIALTGLVCYALGSVHAELVRRGSDHVTETARLRALPRDAFPVLAASAELYVEHLSPDAFEIGLRRFVAGLALDVTPPAS